MSTMEKQLHIRVTGKVQGVWFRAFTREAALSLDIRGYVTNQEDGSVLAIAEGREEDLADFVSRLRQGPSGARVDDVLVTPGCEHDLPTPFTIRR